MPRPAQDTAWVAESDTTLIEPSAGPKCDSVAVVAGNAEYACQVFAAQGGLEKLEYRTLEHTAVSGRQIAVLLVRSALVRLVYKAFVAGEDAEADQTLSSHLGVEELWPHVGQRECIPVAHEVMQRIEDTGPA